MRDNDDEVYEGSCGDCNEEVAYRRRHEADNTCAECGENRCARCLAKSPACDFCRGER